MSRLFIVDDKSYSGAWAKPHVASQDVSNDCESDPKRAYRVNMPSAEAGSNVGLGTV